MQIVALEEFDWDIKRNQLHVYSEVFGGGFPREFGVRSHHTGRVVTFRAIPQHHPLYDEDGWDGELAIYHNVTPLAREMTCVISHAY
jgi:hypothetical protein